MIFFILSTLSVAFAMSPGDCCTSFSWWVNTDCHLCPYGYASTVADFSSTCGWGSTFTAGFAHTWGQCKPAPKPPTGTGTLTEGSCCYASGPLAAANWMACGECPWGYSNDLIDTTSACSAWNALALAGFSTVGTCNYKPEIDGMNDVYLTSRLMQMAISMRHHVTDEWVVNRIDRTSPEQFMRDYVALRDFGYNLEDNNLDGDSFHVIQGEQTTTLDEFGAHIVYFLAEHGGNTELVIAFPGSATIHDWVNTNARLAMYGSSDTKCFQAEGESFCGATSAVEHYETTRDQFLQEIEQLLNKQCVKSCVDVIRVLGHSLGGSAAQFGAIDMAKKFQGRFKVWLSTFASVRALRSDSSDKAHRLLTSNGNRAMRFMLAGDIVPWTGKGLKHIGEAFLMKSGVLEKFNREYKPTDFEALKCCPLCAASDDVLGAIATAPAALVCLSNYHVMFHYIQQIESIKSGNRHFLDNGRVRSRSVTRSCSAFPPSCPDDPLYKQWGYKHLTKACVAGANIVKHKNKSVDECAEFCEQDSRCVAFEYGVNHGSPGGYQARDCQLQSSARHQGCDGAFHNLDLYVKRNRRTLMDLFTTSSTGETRRKL